MFCIEEASILKIQDEMEKGNLSSSSNFCTISIGTDTSNSIIAPARRNGIVGFRPSIGMISNKGIIPISFTLDTAGSMTRTVMDCAIAFASITNTEAVDFEHKRKE